VFEPLFIVRLLTLNAVSLRRRSRCKIQQEGKISEAAGQLIETVPVVVAAEPEIRSTEPKGMVVALIAHCACAGQERVCAIRNMTQKIAHRMDARPAGNIDTAHEWRSAQPGGLDKGLPRAGLRLAMHVSCRLGKKRVVVQLKPHPAPGLTMMVIKSRLSCAQNHSTAPAP